MKDVMGVILGGGQGSRLFPLTRYRSKPAVPIGGKYRLVDIPISNCLHAEIDKVYVLTQFNSASLNRHVYRTYRFDTLGGGFVEILAAEQTQDHTDWYQGTADAVRKQLHQLVSEGVSQYLILSGDHLYRMDYGAFIDRHRSLGAEVSIAVKPVTAEEAPALGILKVDDAGQIVDFREKPKPGPELEALRVDPPPGAAPEETFLASMGIYIFERGVLEAVLANNPQEDFGKHIIPEAIRSRKVFAYPFGGYWADIGTIRAFYEANLALTDPDPPFQFHHDGAPIYTHPRFLAASRIDGCRLTRSLIGEGSVIVNSEVERAVVGIRSTIGPDARIANTVMMGADYYESDADRERNRDVGRPDIGVGRGSVVENAIVDKNARIGEGVSITNASGVAEADSEDYTIRDRIVVIPKNAIIAAGTVI
jgi:glucose-1-phosphate adenylyltransferase